MKTFWRRGRTTHRPTKPSVIYVYYIQGLKGRFHRFSRAEKTLPIRSCVLPSLLVNPYWEAAYILTFCSFGFLHNTPKSFFSSILCIPSFIILTAYGRFPITRYFHSLKFCVLFFTANRSVAL